MKYPNVPTGRVDTEVSQVGIKQGVGSSQSNENVAAAHVIDANPGATVLAVWREPMRDRGNPIYSVEWER